MSAEVTIISGSRKGEHIRLDCEAFEVGADSTCEIYFNPRKDPTIGGRRVLITLEESGWQIQNNGPGLIRVNQRVVQDSIPLRSGDVIRMSDMGPDLLFTLVSSGRGATAESDQTIETPQNAAAGEMRDAEEEKAEVTKVKEFWLPVGIAVLAGGIVLLVLGILTLFLMTTEPEPRKATEVSTEAVESPDPSNQPAKDTLRESTTVAADSTQVLDVRDSDATQPGDKANEPWNVINERVAAAVCLVVAVEPRTGTTFPYGTACAIGDDVLLTSGALAVELEKRQRAGWQLWAEWPESGERLTVEDVRIHKGFIGTADTPSDEKIYWDLAILSLDGSPENSAKLATPEELLELEPESPLACIGIPHDGEPLTRFDRPTIQIISGTLLHLSRLSARADADRTGAPVLLHVKATTPDNMYGSPVVNQAGNIVGVYAEIAELPSTENNRQLQIHYAPVVMLAYARLQGQGVDHWIRSE
jgi:hypothetical protein